MDILSAEDLRAGIRHLHGCDSIFVESVPVVESFDGETVWKGEVQVFDLVKHPKARRAYAWSHGLENEKRRVVAVLHLGPVDSPAKAVRAAIVAEARAKRS